MAPIAKTTKASPCTRGVRGFAARRTAQVPPHTSCEGPLRISCTWMSRGPVYFNSDVVRGAHMQLPLEDQAENEQHMLGKPVEAMCETCAAGQWASR